MYTFLFLWHKACEQFPTCKANMCLNFNALSYVGQILSNSLLKILSAWIGLNVYWCGDTEVRSQY